MRKLETSAAARDTPASGFEALAAITKRDLCGVEFESVLSSWKRSAEAHHVDPESSETPHILTESALRGFVEPIEDVVVSAQPELDRLHKIVGEAGYVTLFCDKHGVAIDHRGNELRSSEFRHWGTWLGGIWSEDAEGTNGIGTCIAEARPLTVHQSQHFRTRHTPLSCSGAPVFDPQARLVAVVDVSSINPDLSAQAHALTLPLVTMSARLIEERLFRERFRKAWICALASYEDQPASLLAVDQDHRVVGADRHARARFYIDQQSIDAGIAFWSMFARKVSPIQKGARSDYPVRLTTCGGDSVFALVSPPLSTSRLHVGQFDATLLLQPRTELLEDLSRRFESKPTRGGLAPGALRRVTEHIDCHLSDELPIPILAAHAGLSSFHFARAFKKSVGMPPHRYVLQQRIKKSAELLTQTALPLVAIAQLVGFTDQSHFSRSFRCHVGRSPSDYRRSHR